MGGINERHESNKNIFQILPRSLAEEAFQIVVVTKGKNTTRLLRLRKEVRT